MDRRALAKAQNIPTRNNHPHRQSARSTSAGHTLLELQRAVGNQAIQRLTSSPFIQAKVAPKSKSPIPVAVREDDEEKKPLVQRACTECEEEKLQDQGESAAVSY